MPVAAQYVQRSTGLTDLVVRSRPNVAQYRFSAADTLDNAFTAPVALFTVPVNTQFISRSLRLQRRGFFDESTTGLTRATFNINDFAAAGVPGDSVISFITVTFQPIGVPAFVGTPAPILVVPPPGFFNTGRRMLTLTGTAPSLAGQANNLPPPGVMNVVLPKFADQIRVENTGANNLFVSFDEGLPEYEIPAAGTTFAIFQEAGIQQIFLRASGGATTFQIAASIVNGLQA